jgi:sterol desaturase/sphingolipid hydroxylase (fatty acid hydroxylase superfamily)
MRRPARRGSTSRAGAGTGQIILSEVSWLSTFDRFKPGRRALLGPIGLLVQDWSRPQRGEAPMFDSTLLERLSVVQPLAPLLLYAPTAVYLVWRSATGALGWPLSLALYVLGLLVWSIVEYGVHRGSFHHEPGSEQGLTLVYLFHGVHHAYPDDSRRWMMPVAVTIPVTSLLFLALHAAVGPYALASFGGFLHGYLTYDLLHYYIHRGRVPGRIGRLLRRHHMMHHYKRPDAYFGVSSPLWDVVFRTR